MIEIRELSTPDIPIIRELTLQVWPQTYEKILTPEQIDYMLEMMYSEKALLDQMMNQGHRYILAEEDQEPLGFASYSPKSSSEKEIVRLHKIYVLPKTQGKGIGKMMIDHIIAQMIRDKQQVLELNVNRYNPARRFYERMGFEIFRQEDIDIGKGYYMNDYVMQKRIASLP